AMGAFVLAEVDGHRTAWLGFYGLTAVACWAKGPAGLLPIAVVLVYEIATHRWQGVTRMRAGVGITILSLLVAPWWLLAANAGRGSSPAGLGPGALRAGWQAPSPCGSSWPAPWRLARPT